MRYPFFISIMVLFFCSCADDSSDKVRTFSIADEGLQRSSEIISSCTHTIYHSLQERAGYIDNVNAKIWLPKAEKIKSYCDSLTGYINQLKETLKATSGLKMEGDSESYNESNIEAVNNLFKEKGETLFNKLVSFRQNVLSVDTELNRSFSPMIPVFTKGFDYSTSDPQKFNAFFFRNIPPAAAMVVLSKFENNVKLVEYIAMMYCHDKGSPVIIHDDFPELLITQNSNYVKPGGEIAVTAGIGIFSTAMKRKVIINGKVIALGDEPTASYNLKAGTHPGKYTVPVTIDFMQPDGTTATMQKNIQYTVIDTTK